MEKDLATQYGPWALIAGGSEGIGLAFAQQLAQAGINLMLLARRTEPLAAARRVLEQRYDVEVRTHAIDLTQPTLEAQVEALIDGREIGLMIYNAGAVHGAAEFLDESLARKQELIALNCTGPVVLAHALAQGMRKRGRGGIILVSSMSGLTGGAYVANYAASKAFDIVLAEGLWAELYPHGVDVLSLIAGATDTPAMRASGIDFTSTTAMTADQVAREGLENLAEGPVHVAGENNRGAAAMMRGENRRLSVALMSAGAAQMYGLPAPRLPE